MKSFPVLVPIVATLALGLTGCSTTHQARSVQTSGFLGDYSQLAEGKGDQALLVYVNEKADFSNYKKVYIAPITVWADKSTADVDKAELQALVDYLGARMREELGKDYEIVEAPGPAVLKLRLAITETESSVVVLDTLSNVVPVGLALSGLKRAITGTHAFVGTASIEGELSDAQSGERLAAAVDRRAGRKVLRGKFGSWNDVQESYDFWASHLRERLKELSAPKSTP